MRDALLLSDDDLLAALAASFPVEPAQPDAAQLHHLCLAVAELRRKTAPAAAPVAAAHSPRWSLPRRLSPLVLVGSVVGVLGAGTGISFALGAPIPAAVRSIVRSVGLDKPATPATLPLPTVPSSTGAVRAARQAESTLHQALAQSNPPPAVISHDSTVLAHRLAQFGGHSAAGAAGATANGHQLLNQACRQLQGTGQTGPTFPGCRPVGVGRDPFGPTSPGTAIPTTRTTELPSAAHAGAGTNGGPVKAPVGGSTGSYPSGSFQDPSRSHSGGTPSGGFRGTTPGTTFGYPPGGHPRSGASGFGSHATNNDESPVQRHTPD
jgi:hypothetical protein